LNTLRELLVIIRIWGLLRQSCLPVFVRSVENLDVLAHLFKLLSRLIQNPDPDDNLTGKKIVNKWTFHWYELLTELDSACYQHYYYPMVVPLYAKCQTPDTKLITLGQLVTLSYRHKRRVVFCVSLKRRFLSDDCCLLPNQIMIPSLRSNFPVTHIASPALFQQTLPLQVNKVFLKFQL